MIVTESESESVIIKNVQKKGRKREKRYAAEENSRHRECKVNEKRECVKYRAFDFAPTITNPYNESRPPTFDSSPMRVAYARRYCPGPHLQNLDLVGVDVVVVVVAAAVETGQPVRSHSHLPPS